MKTIHGFKYDNDILAAFNYFGPLTIEQLQEKITMRLQGFEPPIEILKLDIKRLIKMKKVEKTNPVGYFNKKS